MFGCGNVGNLQTDAFWCR